MLAKKKYLKNQSLRHFSRRYLWIVCVP